MATRKLEFARFAEVIALVSAGACEIPETVQASGVPAEPPRLEVRERLRLTAPPAFPVVDPVALEFTSENELIIADRSERTLWVYSTAGALTGRIARAGRGRGELEALYGAARLGRSLAAYDVNTASISLFGFDGTLHDVVAVDGPAEAPPRTIRSFDDTLLLVTRHPRVGERGALVALVDRTGSIRGTMHPGGTHYRRNGPLFSVLSMPIADGAHGIVLAGYSGSDSLTAYDVRGAVVASGTIGGEALPVVNLARYRPADRDPVRSDLGAIAARIRFAGAVSVSQIVLIDSATAVVQLDLPPGPGQKRRAFADSAYFMPLIIDRATRRVIAGEPMLMPGRLVGRDPDGGALLIREDGVRETTRLLSLRVRT